MARGADAKAGFRASKGPHPAAERRTILDAIAEREGLVEIAHRESAMSLAHIVMGFAEDNYELRGWDHIVECYSLSELAESIQQLIDLNCSDIPMRTGEDALKWWDGICDGVHESRRAAEIAWSW